MGWGVVQNIVSKGCRKVQYFILNKVLHQLHTQVVPVPPYIIFREGKDTWVKLQMWFTNVT